MRPTLPAAVALCLAACSPSSSPPPEESVDFHFAFQTDAASETYWCQLAALPDRPVNAAGFRWKTMGAHHWALFRTHGLDESAVTGKPYPCFTSAESDAADPASVVSFPTTTQTELIYPEPYELPLQPGEVVEVQVHTVNASAVPVVAELDLSLVLAGEERDRPLGQIQFYDPFVRVPANGVGHATMRCAVPQDIDLVWSSTHEHTRGTGFNVFLDPPGGPPSTTPFLSAGAWDQPAQELGVTHVPAGSNVRVYCDYADTKGVDAYQGPDRDANEMCEFFGAYSNPLPGPSAVLFEACVPTAFGGTGDMYGTGTKTCGDTIACVSACSPADAPKFGRGKFDVGKCWQDCLVDSCPSASTQLGQVLQYASSKCPTECAAGAADPACQACLGTNCAAELGSCQAAACSAP